MRRDQRARKSSLLLSAALTALLSLGGMCGGGTEPRYDDDAYRNENAGEQTMDEQMREVEEEINR